jgi:hypothetical protein
MLWALAGVALAAIQWQVDRHTAPTIRYEELAEAVRSPLWLAHGRLFDGVSSNLGWYGLLLLVYQVFGFELFTYRAVRLVLHAAALAVAGPLLRRFLGRAESGLLLVAVAASPTLLAFNRLGTSYGIDLQLLPFLTALAVAAWPTDAAADATPGDRRRLVAAVGLGLLAMSGAMAYPVVIFYLPALAAVAVMGWRRAARRTWVLAASAVVAFALPLGAGLAALRAPGELVRHPADGAGIFRGGGTGFLHDASAIRSNLEVLRQDLLVAGDSYYFRQPVVELGGPASDWLAVALGALAALGVALAAGLALVTPATHLPAALTLVSALGSALLVSAGSGPPGLRRATTLIAAIWLLAALGAWAAARRPAWVRWTLTALLLCLPLHHLVGLPRLLRAVAQRPVRAAEWFAVAPTARESLEHWRGQTADGAPLDCAERGTHEPTCRLSEVFAAVVASREWNAEVPVAVQARQPDTGDVVTLDFDSWATGTLPRQGWPMAPPGAAGNPRVPSGDSSPSNEHASPPTVLSSPAPGEPPRETSHHR